MESITIKDLVANIADQIVALDSDSDHEKTINWINGLIIEHIESITRDKDYVQFSCCSDTTGEMLMISFYRGVATTANTQTKLTQVFKIGI